MPLSYSTFLSSPDCDGSCYWCSFDAKSFARGERLKAYVGIMNGHGPRMGERSVVKVFLGDVDTTTACDVEIQKSKKSRELARAFNRLLASEGRRKVTFTRVLKASMDEVSFVTMLSGHSSRRQRKPRKDQWVIIEERLGKRLTAYIDREGRADKSIRCTLMEALVHYSYHESGGELVLCNLEGSLKGDDAVLCKTPTIHSRRKNYGPEDRGINGIYQVLRHHVCNDLCRALQPLPSDLQEVPHPPEACQPPCPYPQAPVPQSLPSYPYPLPSYPYPLPAPLEPTAPYDPEQLGFLLSVDSEDMPDSPPPCMIDPSPLVYYYQCRQGGEHGQSEYVRYPLFQS